MRSWVWLVAAVAVGCGAEGGSSKKNTGTEGPAVEVPEGDDNVTPVDHLAGLEGTLMNAVVADNQFTYACTGQHGLRVSKVVDGKFELTAASAKFPNGNGCYELAIAPDGLVWATGPKSAEPGSWIVGFEPGVTGDTVKPVATGDLDVLSESIAVSDTHVFVSLGTAGLAIFEKSEGGLEKVATLEGFEQALGMVVDGDRLFVANGRTGVTLVDISDPKKPAMVSDTAITGGTARRLALSGDILYVAGIAVVAAIDVSGDTPKALSPGWESHSSAVDVAVTDAGLIYVANTEDFVILKASAAGTPEFVGSELVPSQTKARARVISVAAMGTVGLAAEWSAIWSYASALDREAADVRLDRLSIDFGVAQLKKGKGIVVQNLGDKPLDISGITVDHALFSVKLALAGTTDATSGILEPGQKELIQVTFEPSDEEPVEATVHITTNDPDEPAVDVKITANAGKGAEVGRPIDPNGEMIFVDALNGNDVTLGEKYAGKAVLLAYFATWCGACAQELPELQRQLDELGNENAAVIAIASAGDTPEQIAVFKENTGFRFEVWIDNNGNDRQLIESGVQAFPTEFVIDREHVVVFNDPNAYAGEAFSALAKAAAK